MLQNGGGTPSKTLLDTVLHQRGHRRLTGGGARFARYCALNNFVSCGNDVTWPSRRLMNHSIAVPAKVLMNSLHRAASEPPTNIICVWKAARWASGSSIPVKVTLGPTSVPGITASTISVKNGVGIGLGFVLLNFKL